MRPICRLELDLKVSPMNNAPADVMLLRDKRRWSRFKGRIKLAANYVEDELPMASQTVSIFQRYGGALVTVKHPEADAQRPG